MMPSRRSGLILFGGLLLYMAILLQAFDRSYGLFPVPSYVTVLGLVLLLAVLVYTVGWGLAMERTALAAASISSLLILLNPLLHDMHLMLQPWLALRGALLVSGIASVWFSMRHWSMFMKSIILMQAFGVALLAGADTSVVLVAALVCWALLNRRPLVSLCSVGVIVIGAWVLSEIARAVYSLIHVHGGDLVSMYQEFRSRYEMYCELFPWSGADLIKERLQRMGYSLSIPWLLLSVVLILERIKSMVRDHRTGPADWLVFCALGSLVAFFVGPGNAFLDSVWLLMFSAAMAPVAGEAIAQKELLMSRAARATAGAALLFSAVTAWLTPVAVLPAVSLAGLIAAYVFSVFGIGASWLLRRDRWIAVLSGATLGSWLISGFIHFRN